MDSEPGTVGHQSGCLLESIALALIENQLDERVERLMAFHRVAER